MTEWIMISEVIAVARLLMALVGGGVLGLFYFGGLWWTVRRLGTAQNVALLFLASFFVRTIITVAGFFMIAFYPARPDSWLLVLAALTGFVLMRLLLVRHWGPISPAL